MVRASFASLVSLLAAPGATVLLGGCDSVVVDAAISYDDRFPDTVIDVYSPLATGELRPAVLVIHGGGWRAGSDRTSMAAGAERLAQAGYVAINLEYRRVPGGEFPRAVQDCLCALAFVRQNAERWQIDPARIAGFGYSAGGHLVSMLGAAAAEPAIAPDCAAGTTGPLAAVASGAGIHDMAAMPRVYIITQFMGGFVEDIPERYAQASPLSHVTAGAPPYLFLHGDQDVGVWISQSRRMADALEAAGTSARVLAIPGGGHLFNHGADTQWSTTAAIDTPESWAALIDFLDRTIGGAS
jgi:acetyl esterase/lipase